MMNHDAEVIRSLPLSHMIYRDSEIDQEKADCLPLSIKQKLSLEAVGKSS